MHAKNAELQPRSAVAYVEVRPPDNLRKLLLKLATNAKLNETFRKSFMRYYPERGSGSGFVVTGGNGHTRLVTNRHVADGADYVTVSFDGNVTTQRGDIVHIDQDYDIAVVTLSSARPGLTLKLNVADEEDVRSVGYPAVGRHGSYQIAPGRVTNACLKGDLVGESPNNCWIQHNAPIDPGSSGGPLLSNDSRVLGVNTLLLRRRNSFFLSVPATYVATALTRADEILANRENKNWMTDRLQKSCYTFVSEMSTRTTKPRRLVSSVSYKLVVAKGLEAFDEMADSEAADDLKDMLEDDPLEAIQLSIVTTLRDDVIELGGIKADERCKRLHPNDDVLSGGDVRIDVEMRNGHKEFAFVFERGQWRLSNY